MYENNPPVNTSGGRGGRNNYVNGGRGNGRGRETTEGRTLFENAFFQTAASNASPPSNRININEILQKYGVIMNNYNTIVERMVPYNNNNFMDGYNNNITLYQKNIEYILFQHEEEAINSIRQSRISTSVPAPTTTTTTTTPLPQESRQFSNTRRSESRNRPINLFPRRLRGSDSETFSFFIPYYNNEETNTQEGLTQLQIEDKTEIILYDSSMNESRCPITFEDFSIGENVCRIKHCGHFFKTQSIQNWLRHNLYCPICRHNLLENDATATATTSRMNELLLPSITIEIQGLMDASENENIISRFFDSMNISTI
jgi:hypothetical protein